MLDPKEEKRFEELRGMCRELKVPAPPEIMIMLQVHDHNGVLIFDDIQRGHSWTRNFYNWIALRCVGDMSTIYDSANYGAGYMSMKRTSAAVTALPYNAGCYDIGWGRASDASDGILVGTGDTAFSIEQFNMVSLIAQGTGAGQPIALRQKLIPELRKHGPLLLHVS
jgi:hypothetical protein